MQQISKADVGMKPIDWSGLTRRYMNPDELEVLIALVRSVKPKRVLEFGVNEGRTAKAILANVPGIERYQGIDVTSDYIPSKKCQRNEVPLRPGHMVANDKRFELLLRPRGSLDLKPSELAFCDAAFIDGDHGSAAVEWDSLVARALVRSGGIIIWHDYHDLGTVDVCEVLDGFDEAGYPLVHVEDTWLVYQRV